MPITSSEVQRVYSGTDKLVITGSKVKRVLSDTDELFITGSIEGPNGAQ